MGSRGVKPLCALTRRVVPRMTAVQQLCQTGAMPEALAAAPTQMRTGVAEGQCPLKHVEPDGRAARRVWESLADGRRGRQQDDGNDRWREEDVVFTLCSYNVLSQACLQNTARLYTRCEPLHLTWEYRWRNLFEELQSLNADIFCLQEVDGAFFDPYYLRFFEQAGFDGVFKQRTGDKHDGCATFWRRALFTLTDVRELTFFRPDARLIGHNVGVIACLSPRQRHHCRLVVGNTHLIYNPKRGDLKLAQMALLLAHVQQLAEYRRGDKASNFHPVIICGDFNTTPSSPLFSFITNGKICYDGLRAAEVGGRHAGGETLRFPLLSSSLGIAEHTCRFASSHKEMATAEVRPSLGHQLSLRSVYDEFCLRGGRSFTSFVNCVASHVDYIFYHGSGAVTEKANAGNCPPVRPQLPYSLQCKGRYSLPSRDDMFQYIGYAPNLRSASDHVPLLASFALGR